MACNSSINLLMFHMQSKDMFKLTPQLCRVAKKEYDERLAELPKDVKCDVSFGKILHLIQHVEKSEFAQAVELLADAYKEHQEMMSYYATETKDDWQPPTCPQEKAPSPLNIPKLNEDDGRNWENKSPVVTKDYELDIKHINNQDKRDFELKPEVGLAGFNSTTKTAYLTSRRLALNPVILADKFIELYKQEWKTAHDELSHVVGCKQAVRHLLWIIARSSIICASLATEQLKDIENSVVGIMASRDPLNKKSLVDEILAKKNEHTIKKSRTVLIEYRHEMAEVSVPMLQQEIKRAISSELGTSLPRRFTGIGNHFIKYSEVCIELICYMYVHDPPMHLEWLCKDQEGTRFSLELYTPYTRAGPMYDYCVWPVVKLHKHGPILRKGVAQGK